jgi:transcriptional regulator
MKTSMDAIETEAVDRLIDRQPLALLVSQTVDGPIVTPVPLLLRRDGGTSTLIGHMARANPQVAALGTNRRALAIFLGPHGYLSPSWLDDRTQAPSWNYALAYMDIDVTFDDSDAATCRAITHLTERMEAGRERSWLVTEMGARLERLVPRIVAFTATVTRTHSRFKLGQSDRDDVFQQSLAAFAARGASDLVEVMRAANPSRSRTPALSGHAAA